MRRAAQLRESFRRRWKASARQRRREEEGRARTLRYLEEQVPDTSEDEESDDYYGLGGDFLARSRNRKRVEMGIIRRHEKPLRKAVRMLPLRGPGMARDRGGVQAVVVPLTVKWGIFGGQNGTVGSESTVLEEDFTSADGHIPPTTYAPGTYERELLTSRIASMRAACRDMSGHARSVVYFLLGSSNMNIEYNTASGDFASLEGLENIDDTCQVRGFDEHNVVAVTGYMFFTY